MSFKEWDTNLKIRLAGESLFNLLYWMYFPFMTIYFSDSLGNDIAGLLMTIPPLVAIVGNIIGGNLADQLGRRFVMLVGTGIQTTMFALFAVSTNEWIQYVSFIGVGLGGALYGPASDAMVADLAPKQERKQIYATFITAQNIGAVFGPTIGAVFFFNYLHELLWACTIVMCIYAIIIFYRIQESAHHFVKQQVKITYLSKIFNEEWKGYSFIFKDRTFLLYILGGVFAVVAIMQLDLYLAIYNMNNVPSQHIIHSDILTLTLNSNEIFGWVLGLNGLMFVLFIMPITKWLKNWSDRNVFLLSAILAGVGMFLVGFTTNVWMLFLLTIIFTFGEIVRAPVLDNFIADYAPERARGKYMGAARLQFTIGRFLAPVTVLLSEWIEPIGIFSIILISALFSGYMYIVLYQRLHHLKGY